MKGARETQSVKYRFRDYRSTLYELIYQLEQTLYVRITFVNSEKKKNQNKIIPEDFCSLPSFPPIPKTSYKHGENVTEHLCVYETFFKFLNI